MAAFTRKMLEELGVEKETVQKVIDAHLEVVNALKDERDSLKEEAGKVGNLEKQIETLKSGDDFKQKYEDEHKAFEDFKAQAKREQDGEKVKAAYRQLLSEARVSEKWIDRIIATQDFSGMKLDKDGKLEKADELANAIKTEWKEYITSTATKGAKVETPPEGNHTVKSMDEIYARDENGHYKLTTEQRQAAIVERLQATQMKG